MYIVRLDNHIKNKETEEIFSQSKKNRHYRKYLKWIDDGNEPEYENESEPVIEKIKEKKYSEIDAILEEKYNEDFYFEEEPWDISRKAQTRILQRSLYAMGANGTNGTFEWKGKLKKWKNKKNQDIGFAQPDNFLDFSIKALERIDDIYDIAQDHKQNIENLSSVDEINDYNIELGW